MGSIWGMVLSVITLGFYMLIWQFRQIKTMILLLRRHEASFLGWILLTMITCGVYGIYFEYLISSNTIKIQQDTGIGTPNLFFPIAAILVCVFGYAFPPLVILMKVLQQKEFNEIIDGVH